MKLVSAIWMILLAVIISTVAAFFSVDGLAALFAATATGVIIMASVLEVGKVTVATWVHANWTKKGSRFLKGYMTAAVVALMLVSSMGIYGYLAKGHLEQSAPLAPIELEIAQKQAQVDQFKDQINASKSRLTQLDTAVNNIITADASKGLRARKAQTAEREEIKASIAVANTEMNKLATDIVPLKLKINAVETKLGPVKYVAQLFGMKDPESAVRIVILLLMFSFDPLAIALIIAGQTTLHEALNERRARKSVAETIPDDDLPLDEVPDAFGDFLTRSRGILADVDQSSFEDDTEGNEEIFTEIADPVADEHVEFDADPVTMAEALEAVEQIKASETEQVLEIEDDVEVAPPMTDQEMVLSILERKPDLLQVMIDAVRESDSQANNSVTASWLDENWKATP